MWARSEKPVMWFRSLPRCHISRQAGQTIWITRHHPNVFSPSPDILVRHTASSIVSGVRKVHGRHQSTKHPTPFFNGASIGDLTNPIHPIFNQNNFVDSFLQYSTLENSLRLASRFVTADPLLPFWYMLLCGPIETSSSTSDLDLTKPMTELSEQQKTEVVSKLRLLASCVTFSSERTRMRGDTGYTERLMLDAPPPFRGVKTHISISRRVFRAIEQTFSSLWPANKSRLWAHFLLINLLLHELAHAAMYAANPRPPAHDPIQAYFLPGARTTEEGMEWETFVFGGLLYECPSLLFRDRPDGLFGTAIVLREWPSPRLVKSYRKSVYPRPFPVKGQLPEHDRLWLIPPGFLEQLFTTTFWERSVRILGVKALRPHCTECFISRGVLGLLVSHPRNE